MAFVYDWHDVLWCRNCKEQRAVNHAQTEPLPGGGQSTKYALSCGCTVEVVSRMVEPKPKPKPDGLPMVPCPACGGQARESVRRDATIPVNGLPWTRHKLDCGHTVDVRAV